MSLPVANARGLDDIASDIHATWAETKRHQVSAWDGYLATGALLLEAREQLPADQDFGAWREGQGFGFNRQWAGKLMQCARETERGRRAATTTCVASRGSTRCPVESA